MAIFGRRFAIDRLSHQVLDENAWFCDLLRYWRPSGGPIDRETIPKHLRLTIRNGYLNFYRMGQSIAKVDFDHSKKLRATIHNKYIYGTDGKGQRYVTVTSAGVPELTGRRVPYDRARHLDDWILKAEEYASEEKRFVNTLVSRNPNVIDLEMGLPAYSDVGEERRAPRMDLVNFEPTGHGWRVVFWEVKRVRDGRARCSGPAIANHKPKVLKQFGAYTDWLQHDGNCTRVALAYQKGCRLIVGFHAIAERLNLGIGRLGPGILAVAAPEAPLPEIDPKPRLLIDDIPSDDSFRRHGHLDKLRQAGLYVQIVEDGDPMTLETRT